MDNNLKARQIHSKLVNNQMVRKANLNSRVGKSNKMGSNNAIQGDDISVANPNSQPQIISKALANKALPSSKALTSNKT